MGRMTGSLFCPRCANRTSARTRLRDEKSNNEGVYHYCGNCRLVFQVWSIGLMNVDRIKGYVGKKYVPDNS